MTKIFENKNGSMLPEKQIWKYLGITTLLGIAFIFLASIKTLVIVEPPVRHFYLTNARYYLTAVSTAMLVAGSCFCIGGLLGFLFGIPRLLNNSSDLDKLKDKNQIIENDNLVQISDWVTKIIVGVGLTQFYQISTSLMNLGEYLSPIFNSGNDGDKTAKIIAIVIVLYFLVLGFLCAYLWTRLYFSKMLAKSQSDVKQIQEELDNKKEELEYKQKELDEKRLELSEKEKELKESQENLETKSNEVDGLSTSFRNAIDEIKAKPNITNNEINNDPNKGKFGGLAICNDRTIKPTVKETSFDSELFTISLEVFSSNSQNPLTGKVIFHLHPTFIDPIKEVEVINGIAKLSEIAYAAFTVGVECDEGKTKLEVDLALLPDAPQLFKER